MQVAKALKRNPRELAQEIVAAVQADPRATAIVAQRRDRRPRLHQPAPDRGARADVLRAVLAEGDRFGARPAGEHGQKCWSSSSPPTRPARSTSATAARPRWATRWPTCWPGTGWGVHREFYYNDAGDQIQTLAITVQARARGLKPGEAGWPESAYNGDYIADIAARTILAGETVAASDGEPASTASGNLEDIDVDPRSRVAYLRREQDIDLQAFGVKFDHYYLESSLYSDGRVEGAVQSLVARGKTYENEGALWLRTTDGTATTRTAS